MIEYEPKNLKRWTMPDSYFGAVWPNYYSSGFGQSRDSDALERSNFECALKALGGETDTVAVVRESHWAVGWVEWIAIQQDDGAALKVADELRERYENYPVVDEEHWSNLEYEEAQSYWASMSVRERCGAIKEARCGASIFAARRDYLPSDDNGRLMEYLR